MWDRRILQVALRQDLSSFIHKSFLTVTGGAPYLHNWHIDALAYQLTRCLSREIRCLVITLPPRSLKSIACSVAFPAWALGRDPTRRIVSVSYSQDLALKHAIDCRAVIESEWYRNLFPRTRIHPDRNTQAEIMTTRRGFRLATSIGGGLTGRGGNVLMIDDPHKPEDVLVESKRELVKSWVQSTAYSRLDNKAVDVIVLIQQRLHEDDLAGCFLGRGDCYHLNLPAIAEERQSIPIGPGRVHEREIGDILHPERESAATLEEIKQRIGSYNFAAQYQQRPSPLGGGFIKWDWFRFYDAEPRGDQIVQSWDTASKADQLNDYSVCTTWLVQGKIFYLLDLLRQRLEYPELRRLAVAHSRYWNADAVLIEDKGSGIQLIQDLRQDGRFRSPVIEIEPEGDKLTRMVVQTPAIEAGQVLLPKEAPWLAEFRAELMTFPKGRHDDQVDSLSQFLAWKGQPVTNSFVFG